MIIIITLKFKNEQVWQYGTRQITSIIGKTVYPNVEVNPLKARLEGCIPVLRGEDIFYTEEGCWKFKPHKKVKSKVKK